MTTLSTDDSRLWTIRYDDVNTVHHVARATGSTSTSVAPYRVELHCGHHNLVGDEPPSEGGGDLGPSPFGLLLCGLAACTATTLRMYAAHKGWDDVATITVDVRYDVDDEKHESIVRTITVPAEVSEEQRERLADIASRTPVTLAIATPITTTIVTADTPRLP